jgi:hypothetical protein
MQVARCVAEPTTRGGAATVCRLFDRTHLSAAPTRVHGPICTITALNYKVTVHQAWQSLGLELGKEQAFAAERDPWSARSAKTLKMCPCEIAMFADVSITLDSAEVSISDLKQTFPILILTTT